MKQIILFSLTILLAAPSSVVNAQTVNLLEECWKKEVNPVQSKYLTLTFSEKNSKLDPNFVPWQASPLKGKGMVWCNRNDFMKYDSVLTGRKSHESKVQYNKTSLLLQDYNTHVLSPVTKNMLANYILQTARYSPIMLIDYFKEKNSTPEKESNNYYTLYKTSVNKKTVSLYIRKSDSLAYQAIISDDDELYGDVLTTINYDEYKSTENLSYPSKITIHKFNGKANDDIMISNAAMMTSATPLLTKPANYSYGDEAVVKPEVSVEKYSDHLHFITLKHTDDKVMVVEFKDFLVVVDAPLNVANGELIISEAKKIAPGKTIKYFVFGNHHPHHIGGLRAFVAQGTKIINSNPDREYVKYIANAPHTINPDELQRHPKALETDTLTGDSKVISDGKFDMKIYFLGSKSQYTADCMLFYFPSEKLLFEDDLVAIRRTGGVFKASQRQAALYNTIKEQKFDVKTIIQSSPATSKDFETVIPFEDLEKSMGK